MDKLKQVLQYQFWILLGVALLIPFVGWGMSRSGMMAQAEARAKTLTDLAKQLDVKPDDPNKIWSEQVETINVEQAKQRDFAWRTLYERQAAYRVWPEGLPEDVSQFATEHRQIYSRTAYLAELDRVRKIVSPYDEDAQSGRCIFNEELLPAKPEEWSFRLPYEAEIDAVQEDVWLYNVILGAIARVNEDAVTILDAPIREIVELLLRGGSPRGTAATAAPGSTKAGGPGGGHGGSSTGPPTSQPSSILRALGGVGGSGSGSKGESIADPKINPDEELGPERAATSVKSGDKSAAGSKPAAGPAPAGGHSGASPAVSAGATLKGASDMGGGASGSGSSRGSGFDKDRYCDDAGKQKEFKTRGFSLVVIMDHRRVPDLLVALSNCEGWPINILRVHVADMRDDDLVPNGGGTGSNSGATDSSAARKMMPAMPAAGRGGAGGATGAVPASGSPYAKVPASRSVDSDGERVATSDRSPLDDPNLAKVAIVGVIYIFNKPPEPTAAPQVTPSSGAVPAVGGAAEPETPTAADAGQPPGDAEGKKDADEGKDATDDKNDSPAVPAGDSPEESDAPPDADPNPAGKSGAAGSG